MQVSHSFTINQLNHVVLSDGLELGMKREEYMYTQLLQSYAMEILIEVDKFCREHGIRYYLAEGTLLGAIRHKGFIPWDDDIDICMFREDYERFKELASKGISDGVELDCEITNPGHWTNIMQVEMTKVTPLVKQKLVNIALNTGPCIDIFPLDYVPEEDYEVLGARRKAIMQERRVMWAKTGMHNRKFYKTLKKRFKYYYMSRLRGMGRSLDEIRQKCFGLMQETNDEKGPFAVNFGSLYGVKKETFPCEWFGEPRMVEFEGMLVPVPAEAEQILERTYKNYMGMPKVVKRKSKHQFTALEDLSGIDDEEAVQIITDLREAMEAEAAEAAAAAEAAGEQIEPVRQPPLFVRKIKRKIKKRTRKVRAFTKRRIYDFNSWKLQKINRKPVEKKTVLFDSFSGLGILDSPRAIFKRMLEREEFKDFKYIWAINNRKIVEDNLAEFESLPNVKIVERSGDEYKKALASSKFLISNSSLPMTFSRKPDQYYLNTWHGVPTKVMGYERPGQRLLSTKNIVKNFLNATHIISANDFTANVMYKRAYKLDGIYQGKMLDSPLPRTDALYNTDREYIISKLQKAGIRTDKKIIIYAPTWKGKSYKKFDSDTDELREAVKKLREGINTDEYEVLLRVHYFLYRAIDADPELRQISVPFTIDTNELLSVTDILISDYSSIFFDFLGTGRPILFYVPDLEEYETSRGLYIPMDELPGPTGTTIEEIAGFINDIENVKEQYAEKYRTMYDWCSSAEDGKVCDRVIDSFILGKEHPEIEFTTKKKRILILSDWGRDFAARNELEMMIRKLDKEKYDVTLLAGAPRVKTTKIALEELAEDVRVLINDRKMNVARNIRKDAYDGLNEGIITPDEAAKLVDMEAEWQRLLGDAEFDELVLVQPIRAKELWLIIASYAPVAKKSFVMSTAGLSSIYQIESNMTLFDSVCRTLDEYADSLE